MSVGETIQGNSLEALLERAALELPGAAEEFFHSVLDAEVFVPLKLTGRANSGDVSILGPDGATPEEFVRATFDGRQVIPIFSSHELAESWAENEVVTQRRKFQDLLLLVKGEDFLHLNPGAEFGKEFSPWEIEQLRSGHDAVPEVAATALLSLPKELEIDSGAELYPELKPKLVILLESYSEVQEAFLIAVCAEGEKDASLMLGLKHEGLKQEKLAQLRQEVQEFGYSHLGKKDFIALVEDVYDLRHPSAALFSEVTPFYIAQQPLPSDEKQGVVDKLFSSIFSKKSPKQM